MKSYGDIAGDGGSNVGGQVEAQLASLERRLASVRHTIAVMSGKGGVGKSSLAVHLASALSIEGRAVGVLDADINGASVSKISGVRGQTLRRGETGILPATTALGVKVMAIDLFMRDDHDPVMWNAPSQERAHTWRTMMEMAAIREFASDTEWGRLDLLLVDLPPGTDKLPNVAGVLPRISGTVVVTIPSSVSGFVVGRSIRMARDVLKTPVLGLVNNMSSYVCAHCETEGALFEGMEVEALAREENVPLLGNVPFDPRIATEVDGAPPFMEAHAGSPAARALREVALRMIASVEEASRERRDVEPSKYREGDVR